MKANRNLMAVLKSEGDLKNGIVGLDLNPGDSSYLSLQAIDPSNIYGGKNGILQIEKQVENHWTFDV